MYPIDLSGKVAVVMGVANQRSIAWGVAEHLARAGARLAFTYAGEKFGSNLERLTEGFADPRLYECNVEDDDQIERTFGRIREELGHVDMLVHSIAFAPRDAISGRFVETGRDAFRIALDISAYSLLRVVHAGLPSMEGRNAGVLAMSYLAAERAVPRYNVMGTAKAALEQIVRQLALELGPQGIRVNAISAGPINTLSARGVQNFTDALQQHRERAPLQRNVTIEDVGRAALFLLSDLASGVTGETLHVDGGYHIVGV